MYVIIYWDFHCNKNTTIIMYIININFNVLIFIIILTTLHYRTILKVLFRYITFIVLLLNSKLNVYTDFRVDKKSEC